MSSLWWLSLSLLALPLWWHRERRQRVREQPLATARFLPPASPRQLRVWRWSERLLLLVRCLLLAFVVAWLADLVLPWRGDAVLVAPGTDSAWAERQARAAGFANASGVGLPSADAFGWLALHEREWRSDSRLLILGDVPMPAMLPRSRHLVEVRAAGAPPARSEIHVAVFSPRAALWQAMFAALDGPRRVVVDSAQGKAAGAELIVWDQPGAPPASLRAPLWWVTAVAAPAFPELNNAPVVDGVRYADSPRGRLWSAATWPPADAAAARTLYETWQRLHYAPLPYTLASQAIAPAAGAAPAAPAAASGANGALHYALTLVLIALFALERMMAHVRRR